MRPRRGCVCGTTIGTECLPWCPAATPVLEDLPNRLCGGINGLAKRMRVSRQTLWTLLRGAHARMPIDLLRAMERELRRAGFVDGGPTPTLAALTRAWQRGRAALTKEADA